MMPVKKIFNTRMNWIVFSPLFVSTIPMIAVMELKKIIVSGFLLKFGFSEAIKINFKFCGLLRKAEFYLHSFEPSYYRFILLQVGIVICVTIHRSAIYKVVALRKENRLMCPT